MTKNDWVWFRSFSPVAVNPYPGAVASLDTMIVFITRKSTPAVAGSSNCISAPWAPAPALVTTVTVVGTLSRRETDAGDW